jgi:hypothetical protein
MELRHGLMRAAKVRLMSMGRKPTKQAARALVDQHFSKLRARIREETPAEKRDESGACTTSM